MRRMMSRKRDPHAFATTRFRARPPMALNMVTDIVCIRNSRKKYRKNLQMQFPP